MAIPDNKRLRQLVSDYYHGLVTNESYREQRAILLDNIGKHVVNEQDSTATLPQHKAPEAETQAPVHPIIKEERSSTRPMSLVIGIALVGVILLGAYLVLDPFAQSGSSPDESDVVADGVGQERGEVLIEEFLTENDWKQDSLGNFALAWEALNDPQRKKAIDGRHYRRFTMLLHRRIGEQLALDGSTDNDQLAPLVELAATIGAPYERVQVSVSDFADPVDSIEDEREEAPAVTEDQGEKRDVVQAKPVDVGRQEEQDHADSQPAAEEANSVDADTLTRTDDPCQAGLAKTRRPYCRDVLTTGGTGPDMVVLPVGSFRMGSDAPAEESPSHIVEIEYHIAMSSYEITAQEFAQYCVETNVPCPDSVSDDDAPVVSVTWDDAEAYVEWLSVSTGFVYRLPSEAEWEFAARAGTETPYFFGDEITPSAAHAAENGTFELPISKGDRIVNRNDFRLYHMSGNVREWVQDVWYSDHDGAPGDGSARVSADEEQRVVRGGSYKDPASKLRSAAREPLPRTHRDEVTGFRVVREIRQ
jgi:formylglycine-generating enzyme required for sulfatase activity